MGGWGGQGRGKAGGGGGGRSPLGHTHAHHTHARAHKHAINPPLQVKNFKDRFLRKPYIINLMEELTLKGVTQVGSTCAYVCGWGGWGGWGGKGGGWGG